MRNIFLHASSNILLGIRLVVFLSEPSFEIQEKFLNTVNEWGQEGWEIVQVFTSIEEKSILGIPVKAGILLKRKVDETSIV